MRRIVTAISAVALAFGMVSSALPANAATGFDSQWVTQSDYLSRAAGSPSELIQAFFSNTGTTSWVKGTSSQVDLAACLNDKVTCSAQDAAEADFNDGWLSSTRYAAQDQTTVAPGGIAAFKYRIKFPSTIPAGTYNLNGDVVVSATGERIHPEGYFHQQIVTGAPAASCTPTGITTTPTTATRQVGTTHTQSATVDCDAPAGSTTRPKAANAQVTFVVDAPVGSLNADLTLTATTNADGLASVTWSRANPDADTVAVYPTAAPAVRKTATITWQVAANPIVITPDTTATALVSACRAYTITTQSTTTGAAASRRVLLNFVENSPTVSTGTAETTQGDKGAFFKIPSNGATFASPTNIAYTSLTTDSSGSGTFDVCGPGGTTEFTVTPVGYLDTNSNGTRETGEDIQDTGGAVSFQVSRATITLTPDTAATSATTGGRLYSITAVDQFGSAFTGTLDVGFVETTDDSTSTTTSAVITFTQVGGTAPTSGGTCNSPGTAPDTTVGVAATTTPGTAQAAGTQRVEVTFGTSSTAYFAICSTVNGDIATPVSWQDIGSNDNVRQTSEPQDTGGTTTWKTAAATSAMLSPSSATNIASSETTIVNDNSSGEERFTASVVDQSGNQIIPSTTNTTTVVFTVKNTSSSGNVVITECRQSTEVGISQTAPDTTVEPNTTATCTVVITANTLNTAIVEIDKGAAGSATVDCTETINTTTPTTLVCSQATKTWVTRGTEVKSGQATSATGTVVAFDKTLDMYTLSTSVGNVTVDYFPTDSFSVDGTTATMAQFETNLTIGDKVTFTGNPVAPTVNHALTNQ